MKLRNAQHCQHCCINVSETLRKQLQLASRSYKKQQLRTNALPPPGVGEWGERVILVWGWGWQVTNWRQCLGLTTLDGAGNELETTIGSCSNEWYNVQMEVNY